MSYSKTIEEIQNLPHYREFSCKKCGHKQKVYILVIHGNCDQCGTEYKFRGITPIGSEIEDVIDTVLDWIGKGNEFEDAMKWKQTIDSYEE
jgi:transcription elongation factor Elf1